MTRSRQLDDKNIEAWRSPRRVAVWTVVAVATATAAFITDSLRRSVAQLGAAVPVAVPRDANAAEPPNNESVRPRTSNAAQPALPLEASASEPDAIPSSEKNDSREAFELEQLAPLGPLTGAQFAELLESGALGDTGADAEAVAALRRALDAAGFEAELEP